MKRLIVLLIALLLCSCGTQSAPEPEPAPQSQTETQAETPESPEPKDDTYAKYNAMAFEVTDKGTDDFGYHHFDVKITNNGDFIATLISPVVCFVDETGNTLTTSYLQTQGNLKPGTYVIEDAFSGGDFCDVTKIHDIVIENYSYYTVGESPEYFVDVNTVSKKANLYEA